jgi:hypothetical protein
MPAPSPDISAVIELAIAPVFLLVGIASFINVFAGRLARIVDRSRALEASTAASDHAEREAARKELRFLRLRARWVHFGMTAGIGSALMVSLLIVLAFLGHFLQLGLPRLIGGLFIAAMVLLIGALLAFLREVYLALRSLRIGKDS